MLKSVNKYFLTSLVGVAALLSAGLLSYLSGQTPQQLPSAEPSPAPMESPTPSPSPVLPLPSPTPLPAPLNYHRWGSISLFNGLPSDSVRAIAQTPDGVMWFGTENGLARFDGRRIQKYSLGSADADRILVLKTGPTGSLWVGSAAGAFEYGEDGYRRVSGTEDLAITSILVESEILLGTSRGTVLRAARTEDGGLSAVAVTAEPILDPDRSPLAVTALNRYRGQLLASTAGRGVFVLEPDGAKEFRTSPRPLFVNAAVVVEDGLILGADAAGTQSGIYEFEGASSGNRLRGSTGNVRAVEWNDGGLWAGTDRSGLFFRDNAREIKHFTFANTSGGLRSDFIFTIFTDREGVVWIGTNRGLSRYDRLGLLQETVSESPNGNFIRTLFRSADGKLYAGSNRGLFVKQEEMWKPVAGYERHVVHAITEPRPGRLVVGSSDEGTETRSYALFRNEWFAAVHGRGLERMTSSGNAVVYELPTISTLAASDDRLWIGTLDGQLLSYDDGSVSIEATPETGAIRAIRVMPNETVWIAAEKGVYRLTDAVTERIIPVEDARDIFVSKEEIWAATTTRGLVHARHDETFGWLVSALGFEQGFPSEKTFSILPENGTLLVASNRGVVTYRPAAVAPKLIVTRVISQRLHDLKEIRSTIELEYPQNSLVVEVAGQSSRTAPQEFQYGFLLRDEKGEVADKRFSYDPEYSLSDLKPGSYTIEATAFDRDLRASDPLRITFSVARAPFPWTATALAVLLAIALIALLWAIIERGRIALRNRELKQAKFDLAHEAERERGRIARDLHDQTLADLRNLMLRSDKLGIADPTFREDIESVSKEVRRICEDLSPSVLENVGLIAALEFLLSHSIENYSFDSSKASDDAVTFPTSVQLQIYRIAQEAITNIQKHSDAGVVKMSIETPVSGSFEFTIADDGTPFTPDSDAKLDGRGIGGIRSRASLINARVEWLNDGTNGNLFKFRLGPNEAAS